VKHTWDTVGPPPAGIVINLYITLNPDRENTLTDALYEVSNPGHQKYGAHLSKEQIAELVAPHQDTLELVHSWLEHHGVPSSSISTSHGGGWLSITGVPVSQANELLCASYQLYRQTWTNETKAILRTVSYALPVVLHAHVQTVAPNVLRFTAHATADSAPALQRRSSSDDECDFGGVRRDDGDVRPSFLRSLYKTQNYVPAAMGQNALGILGLGKEYPSQEDLTAFMTEYRTEYSLRRPSLSTQLTANVQTVAGIVSLLNDYLLSTHRAPLGFLNPWLYKDLLGGNGFTAISGWDPVTCLTSKNWWANLMLDVTCA